MNTVVRRFVNKSGERIDLVKTIYITAHPFDNADVSFNLTTFVHGYEPIEDNSPYESLVAFVDDKLGLGSYDKLLGESVALGWAELDFAVSISERLFKEKNLVAFPIFIGRLDNQVAYYFRSSESYSDWRGSFVGFAWLDKDELKSRFDISRLTQAKLEELQRRTQDYLDVYNAYLNGKVYDYVAYDNLGEQLSEGFLFYDYGFENDFIEDIVMDACCLEDESFQEVEVR